MNYVEDYIIELSLTQARTRDSQVTQGPGDKETQGLSHSGGLRRLGTQWEATGD